MSARVVLVTGGNRGIGRSIAQHFQSLGDTVVITHRSGQAPIGFHTVTMDVTSTESVEAGFNEIESRFGPVEILVSNAGITRDGLVLRMSDEDFHSVIDANLVGAFRVARRASKGMLKLKRGSMIFIGSVIGSMGQAGQVNYAASKAGLVGLAKSLAKELGSRAITCNVIAPGFVETDMTSSLAEDRKREIIGAVPLRRIASSSEIASVAGFLASEGARYITGVVVPVDGGLGMGS